MTTNENMESWEVENGNNGKIMSFIEKKTLFLLILM